MLSFFVLRNNEDFSSSRNVKIEEKERSDFETEVQKNDLGSRKHYELREKEDTNTDLDTNRHYKNLNNKGDKLKTLQSDCSNKDVKWNVGDTILGRYFIKKGWKHYVGVVTSIIKVKCLYTIDYYKTIKKNGNLIFMKPKKQDIDEVPYSTIVSGINLLQIKEKPETFVLYSDEDSIYFVSVYVRKPKG